MTDQETETKISLTRTIDAPAEEVFAAWTDPALLEQWQAERASFEAFSGGEFRFESVDPDNPDVMHVVTGTVDEYAPDERLVETWRYVGDDEATVQESVLTVTFRALDPDRTEIGLTEQAEAHKDPESRIFSIEAWSAALEELAELLE